MGVTSGMKKGRGVSGTAWSLAALAGGLAAGILLHRERLGWVGTVDAIVAPIGQIWIAALRVTVANQRGVLAKVASEIALAGSNIDSISMEEDRALFTPMLFVLEVANRQHLARVMRALKRLPEVEKLVRVRE